MLRTPLAAALVLAAAPLLAAAQTYRCVDKEGHKHYSETIPQACVGVPVEVLDSAGVVVKRILPPPTAAERAAQEAAEQKKSEEAQAAKEQERRDRALLATYASVQDIEDARARALEENERALTDIRGQIAKLEKRRDERAKALATNTGADKPPENLTLEIRQTDADLATQKTLLAAKQKEIEQINAKYDADKKRFSQLSGGAAPKQ